MNEAALLNQVPRVSVVMPVDRVDPYLEPAIESILRQAYSDFELLLVENSRKRELHEMILRATAGDARVRILEAPRIGGLALALNLGIAAARGEYIARMDGDDVSLPERIEEQVRYMDAHPDVAVLGCRIQLIDEKGSKVARPYPFYETDRQIRRILPFRTPMPHPALMLRREVLLAVAGYKYGHSAEDWEMLIRIARDPSRKFHNLDRVLFEHRRHSAQVTRPDLIRAVFSDTAAFLFSEFLRTWSWKYLAGICLKHPLVVKARRTGRRLQGDDVN
ncbi:MAG: glycosyltransferase [Acidobacteriaceae bacterium]